MPSGACLVSIIPARSKRFTTSSIALKSMLSLDHKIPPPLVAVACAALGYGAAHIAPEWSCLAQIRIPIAALLLLAGLALDVCGLVAFRRAKTTVNPLSPEKSASIVDAGPYAFTRNPMYLGMAIILLAFCVYLANPLSVVAVSIFVAYITRYQILPEERLLLKKFGEPYAQYKRSVRRWL